MPRYANVDRLMEHAISLDWSILKWVNEVDICTAINPNVVERKKGKWINSYNSGVQHLRCSECGVYIEATFFANDYDVNFCPKCGAYMRGERDETD